jgi:hypothetical protein
VLVSYLARSFFSSGDTLGRRSVFFLSVRFFLLLGVRSFLFILSNVGISWDSLAMSLNGEVRLIWMS